MPRPVEGASEHVGVGRIADAFVLRSEDGRSWFACAQCAHEYGPPGRDPKLAAVMREGGIEELSALNRWGLTDKLVARFFYCPSCALLVAVDVQEKGDPIIVETRVRPAPG